MNVAAAVATVGGEEVNAAILQTEDGGMGYMHEVEIVYREAVEVTTGGLGSLEVTGWCMSAVGGVLM
jgi:hypothetical protein